MASSSNTVCRYFMNNCCRNGDRCTFSHSRISTQSDNICRYYQQGSCVYGTGCRYDHVRTAVSSSSSTPKQSTSSMMATATSHRPFRPNAPEFIPKCRQQQQPTNDNAAFALISVPIQLADIDDQQQSHSAASAFSYASAVIGDGSTMTINNAEQQQQLLCPYMMVGQCFYGDNCSLLHGEMCDLCNRPVLHPTDKTQRANHRRECVDEHERAMEEAFADARSVDKQCGICMENIVDKKGRFGILQNCRHCFCLECIRKWRKSQFENKIVRSCPECRTHSDYIIPCVYWVEDGDDKDKLIADYRSNTAKKICKYFKEGVDDECPFGNKCFYKHQRPDGTIVVGDSPRAIRRRQADKRRISNGGRRHSFVMWDFFERRGGGSSDDEDDDERFDRLLDEFGVIAVSDPWLADSDSDELLLLGLHQRRAVFGHGATTAD